jgi:hypothetical protein
VNPGRVGDHAVHVEDQRVVTAGRTRLSIWVGVGAAMCSKCIHGDPGETRRRACATPLLRTVLRCRRGAGARCSEAGGICLGDSPAIHSLVSSGGFNARVVSTWIMAWNCSAGQTCK